MFYDYLSNFCPITSYQGRYTIGILSYNVFHSEGDLKLGISHMSCNIYLSHLIQSVMYNMLIL